MSQRTIREAVSWFCLTLCLTFLCGCQIENQILFPGVQRAAPTQASIPVDAQRLWIDVPDGRVEAWFFRGEGVADDTPAPTVIFAHGNGELIDDWPHALSEYRRLGFNILLPEFRGYGRSTGVPSQEAIVDDFSAFYDRVVNRGDVDANRIVLHGRSLGGGVVLALAGRRPPAACIVQSTFESVPKMARRYSVPASSVTNQFDNRAAISQLACPVLIVHGRDDRVVPLSHAQQLDAAAADSQLVIFESGHNDLPMDDAYWRVIARFLDRALPPPHLPASAAALQ